MYRNQGWKLNSTFHLKYNRKNYTFQTDVDFNGKPSVILFETTDDNGNETYLPVRFSVIMEGITIVITGSMMKAFLGYLIEMTL